MPTWKRGFKLPWRKIGLLKIITMIKWIRTGRLSIKNSLSTSFSLVCRESKDGPRHQVLMATWACSEGVLSDTTCFIFLFESQLHHKTINLIFQ